VELDGKYQVSGVAIQTALGTGYRNATTIKPDNFPFEVKNPIVSATYETTNNNGAFLWATNYTTSTSPCYYYLVRPATTTATNGFIHMRILGTI
jgi:hypothetical protein